MSATSSSSAPAPPTQEKRLLTVDTPLDEDKLLINHFSGRRVRGPIPVIPYLSRYAR
jgi:hypothetical protein